MKNVVSGPKIRVAKNAARCLICTTSAAFWS